MIHKGRHIVVFGYPRSGSTMFYCMLKATVTGFKFYDWELPAKDAYLQEAEKDKITKHPMDIRDVKYLNDNIQDVQFILCVRDPRSVLVSKVADGRFKVNWDYCLHKSNRIVGRNEGFIERHELVKNTLKYNPFIVKFEELVLNPYKIQGMLEIGLNLKFSGKFDDFHKSVIPRKLKLRLNGVRPVEKERIDSWKAFPERIYKQFIECPELFEIVKFWGYEKNNEWFEKIKEKVC